MCSIIWTPAHKHTTGRASFPIHTVSNYCISAYSCSKKIKVLALRLRHIPEIAIVGPGTKNLLCPSNTVQDVERIATRFMNLFLAEQREMHLRLRFQLTFIYHVYPFRLNFLKAFQFGILKLPLRWLFSRLTSYSYLKDVYKLMAVFWKTNN